MDRQQWIKRLIQHTVETTERLYVRVLEDAEVLRGLLGEGVEAWWEGLQQDGVALGQFVAKTARQCTSGTGIRKVRDRLVWIWSQSSQLQS